MSTVPVALTELSDADLQRAMEWFRQPQPHLEQGAALGQVARAVGVSYRSDVRWVSLYRPYGLSAFVRKGQTNRGGGVQRNHLVYDQLVKDATKRGQ